MAQRAAHVTSEIHSTNSEMQNQPSIFDVLAQESLMSSLKPAIRHVSRFLAWSYPNLFAGAIRYFDEYYAVFELFLQQYHLKRYDASFAEKFYDIKRVTAFTGNKLSSISRWLSLIYLVIVPYLRTKLDKLYERLKANSQRATGSATYKRLVGAFLFVYPMIGSILEFWTFALQTGYLLSRSNVHSPWLVLAGVRLQQMTPADYGKKFASASMANASILSRLWNFIQRSLSATFRMLSKLLGLGLLLAQFMDTWQTSQNSLSAKPSVNSLPIPAAPQVLTEQMVVSMDPQLCPICRKKRQNDAVLSVSGYIYCYVCIAKYLQQHRCCPVTKVAAGTEHLIRLYI